MDLARNRSTAEKVRQRSMSTTKSTSATLGSTCVKRVCMIRPHQPDQKPPNEPFKPRFLYVSRGDDQYPPRLVCRKYSEFALQQTSKPLFGTTCLKRNPAHANAAIDIRARTSKHLPNMKVAVAYLEAYIKTTRCAQ